MLNKQLKEHIYIYRRHTIAYFLQLARISFPHFLLFQLRTIFTHSKLPKTRAVVHQIVDQMEI